MPKRLRSYPIYLAPKIQGYRDINGMPIIYDEQTQESLDPDNIDDKIKIYERQVNEWFLARASRLLKGENNGFIVLMIATSYIEGVQQYINGIDSNRQSRTFFKEGLRRIFTLSSVSNGYLDDFYVHVRCGLFHNGMSGSQVIISNGFTQPIDFSQDQTIKINVVSFLAEINKDFSEYISKLKKPSNIDARDKFDRMFSVQ